MRVRVGAEAFRAAALILGLILVVLRCWTNWELVVRPLKDAADAWGMELPAPFYLFEAPVWFWHDLSYLAAR